MLDHVSRKGQMLIHRVWLRSVKKWKMLKNGYNKFEKVSVRGSLISDFKTQRLGEVSGRVCRSKSIGMAVYITVLFS